ncbi:hypothetical protein [Larkinella soli]|uniref:hypothetical protein n=1 Tax=Larkinella soli TaxID=1770527 RepID=UPI000FFB5C94|nr:hypothetical protein [Larkinella soli]
MADEQADKQKEQGAKQGGNQVIFHSGKGAEASPVTARCKMLWSGRKRNGGYLKGRISYLKSLAREELPGPKPEDSRLGDGGHLLPGGSRVSKFEDFAAFFHESAQWGFSSIPSA